MKNTTKLGVFILFLIFTYPLFSQGCSSGADDAYWLISLPNSKRLANSETSYHCHKFVRIYYEGNCTNPKPSWNNTFLPNCYCSWQQSGIPDETDYSFTNKYIMVPDEAHANIIRYKRTLGGIDHSQVKDQAQPGKYISKYDFQGPLVGHNPNYSYYHLNYPGGTNQYYFYLGPIIGNSSITTGCPVNYSVNNNTAVGYTWTVVSGTSYVSILSGANTNSVWITGISNGSAVLQLRANSSQEVIQQINLTISLNTLINGTYDNGGINNQCLLTVNRVGIGNVVIRVTCPNATTFTWQKTSGNIDGYFPNGPTASFTMTSRGSITLLVTAKNGSSIIASRSITFYNY